MKQDVQESPLPGGCDCDVCTLTTAIVEGSPYGRQKNAHVRIEVLVRLVAGEMALQLKGGLPHTIEEAMTVFAALVQVELRENFPPESGKDS